MYKQVNIFQIYTVGIYIYIINIHSTHISRKQKLLFLMQLITINNLTALIYICVAYIYIYKYI